MKFEPIAELQNLADTYLADRRHDLMRFVLEDSRFVQAPGGSKHHHNYPGGRIPKAGSLMERWRDDDR